MAVSGSRAITQDNHLHMSLRNDPFQPINVILRIPIGLGLGRNGEPSMNKTEAETVLRAVSGGLVDKEQHRPLKLASGSVAMAVPEDVGSHGHRQRSRSRRVGRRRRSAVGRRAEGVCPLKQRRNS